MGACGGGATTAPGGGATTAPGGGATPGASSAATETLKIGIEGPFTGPNALTGEEMKNASTMAFDAINWTVGPYKIEPVYIDDQSDPAKGAAAYEQAAVSQKITAGILGWHSSVAVAQMEVTAKYKIPHFFAMGATGVVNEKFNSDQTKYGYWTSKGWPDPAKLSIAYVTSLNDAIAAGTWTPASKTVAVYGEDTDWGRSFGAGIKQQFQDTGWSVVSEDYFPTTQTDFSALVARYKSNNVPVIAGTSTIPASISAFIKAADDAGVKSMIVADGLGWIGDWYKLTGTSSNYVLDQIPGWTTDKAKKFADDYKAKFNKTPSPSAAGLSYDFTSFFIKIMQQTLADSGSITSETLYKTAQDKLWTGQLTYTDGIIMSNYAYSADTIPDPVVGKGAYIFPVLQYQGGVGAVIWPPEWKTGDIKAKP
ncbi:MAG: branched-chain amino acid ABC transporter substrate-binding protein [Anaerolinea sp.]|nr:branched-chain amino acid ABC transporter substrate-binding protein [Anaerolinea sp.]